MKIFTRINERGTTIVMATHNAAIVNKIRHRVIAIGGATFVRAEIEGGNGNEGYNTESTFASRCEKSIQ